MAGESVPRVEPTAEEPAATGHDRERLARRLDGLASFAATFTQTMHGARGQVLEESTGHVLLARPRFKWVVDQPYPQVIVTDGGDLKIYDPDLEQLTIRPLEEALADTPIALLTTEGVALDEGYDVMWFDETDGESFVIVPLSEESLFAEIRLLFSPVTLSALNFLDHLGQRMEIRFELMEDATVIQSVEFQLEVPPGTDVIGG
jgi:outer membrane lipoprotein carrier protein